MKVIWKFPFRLIERQRLHVPRGAEFLTVQMQGAEPTAWALVDPKQPVEAVELLVFGTGHNCADELTKKEYLGTFQQVKGDLIWHVFVVRP